MERHEMGWWDVEITIFCFALVFLGSYKSRTSGGDS